MCKQDRQGVRTASELIQRYKFGETFAEIMGLAQEAKNTADNASGSADELDKKLTHEEIFNRLTKNGELQGLYRGDDGELYVNASYLKSGIIDAAVVQVVNMIANNIKTGVLKSVDETTYFDLDNAEIVCQDDTGSAAMIAGSFVADNEDGFRQCAVNKKGIFLYPTGKHIPELGPFYGFRVEEDQLRACLVDLDYGDTPTVVSDLKIGFKTINGVKTLVAYE